ncbi:hypothetical protein [Euzebya rosea]|uniref:hypothetical protein n=1 Tax=Euzebya rosea TaxID=2052804 RepID=UPI000D3E9429|nr:hypothetical protein [Euzebya rosea]
MNAVMSERRLGYHTRAASSLLLVALVLLLPMTPAAAKQDHKVDVCHRDGDAFTLIRVSDRGNAVEAHRDHGDALPGDPVPGDPTMVLDEACQPTSIDDDGDGVPNGDDNCPGVANADQLDRFGSSDGDVCERDANDNGVPDVSEANICVHVNGTLLTGTGTATCSSDRTGIAIAEGDSADAWAVGGSDNLARAIGPRATAWALTGDRNTALARGADAHAQAAQGDDNVAEVRDSASGSASAIDGDRNTAIVENGAHAADASGGNDNYAYAGSPGCHAHTVGVSNASVTC